jgi:short subunit dehydrogenase-like uncharacterized protein
MPQPKPFDIAVYGASGFTGRLVAEYLAQHREPGRSVSWAMAGRSLDKLAAVRDEIGAPKDTPLIAADAADPASLAELTSKAKVVLTTVGPYQLYGDALVAACAQSGTDYVDLCGEPAWMRAMIDRNEAAAKASGARIVFSCGFDSIPFDLGVLLAQDIAQKRTDAPSSRIRGRVRKMKGTFSGGTAASMRATMDAAMKDASVIQLLRDPFALTPGFAGAAQPSGMKPEYDSVIESWVAPFIMAAINTRNVHRSNFLRGHSYGQDFVYDEMLVTGPGEKGEAAANAIAKDRSMASGEGPKPGEGPSKEERETGHYDVLFVADLKDGARVHVGVTGDRDPGYGSTSKMIAQSAICLLDEAKAKPGGIWTPASAMGLPLIDRLTKYAGMTFREEQA